jgi:hypothetical protein
MYIDLVERIKKSAIWTILWEIIDIELHPNNMKREVSFHFCKARKHLNLLSETTYEAFLIRFL